jgi:hypothetical protein
MPGLRNLFVGPAPYETQTQENQVERPIRLAFMVGWIMLLYQVILLVEALLFGRLFGLVMLILIGLHGYSFKQINDGLQIKAKPNAVTSTPEGRRLRWHIWMLWILAATYLAMAAADIVTNSGWPFGVRWHLSQEEERWLFLLTTNDFNTQLLDIPIHIPGLHLTLPIWARFLPIPIIPFVFIVSMETLRKRFQTEIWLPNLLDSVRARSGSLVTGQHGAQITYDQDNRSDEVEVEGGEMTPHPQGDVAIFDDTIP